MKREAHAAVLVAEDNPVNQKVMSLLLDMLSIRADLVADGKQAIEAARSDQYSLILMDIMMPEVDGFEAAFQIRKREFKRGLHTPIIACTALDKEKIVEQCIRSGIDDYLAKPLSKDALKDTIERWSSIPIQTRPSDPNLDAEVRRMNGDLEEIEAIDHNSLKMLYGLEQLDDILVIFLTVTQAVLAQMESAINNKNVADVKRMAHELKGSSAAVSAKEMSELCLRLEEAAETGNFTEAEKLYTSLGLAFARVREFMNHRTNKSDLDKAS
jgi:two-component system, sensor histidine kinase and response regulator